MRSLRLAFRTLTRTPFVTSIAVASLALGIGANAAIFSMFDQFLLQPVRAVEPGRLVNLGAPGPKSGSQSCNQAGDCDDVFSYRMFRDLEAASAPVLTGLAGHVAFGTNLAFRRVTRSATGMLVSGSYFPVLGLQPTLGRLLGPADDEGIGGHFVAVLSHRYWTTRLGADPAVIGEPIVINGRSFTVVGVGPEGFDGTTLGTQPDVFVPISMHADVSAWFTRESFEKRNNYWVYLFGRLKPGVSLEQARTTVGAAYRQVITAVEVPLQKDMNATDLAEFKARTLTMVDGTQGQSSMHREAKTPIAMLFGVTVVVLLIACANIANLLLARGAGRSTEMAVRLSLGAQRRQVIWQLLQESLLLALLAGVCSIVVAQWTLVFVRGLLPPETGQVVDLGIRWPIVAFSAGLAVVTGLLFGLYPALHSTRTDLVTGIRSTSGQASGARGANRVRTTLVMVQVALAMALLTSAGLFIKSLRNVSRVDLGVQVDDLVTFSLSPALNGYPQAKSTALYPQVEEALAGIPGVRGVTASRVQLIAGSNWSTGISIEGFRPSSGTEASAHLNHVGPGYFQVLGVSLRAGREFTPADIGGAPQVVVVNEAFTRQFGLGRQAVGKRMATESGTNIPLDIEIVGVVPDVKYSSVKDEVPPVFYLPYRQVADAGDLAFYVKVAPGASAAVLRAIPGVVARFDPDLPVEGLRTMPEQVKENIFMDRMITTLSSAFAALATLLAAIGLYGVLAYTVAQRTREIGVRMALGADAGAVRRMVLRQVGRLILVGGAVGLGVAWAIGRAARSLLFGLEGHDPAVFALSTVALALVALVAGYVPARRASRVNPMAALRWE